MSGARFDGSTRVLGARIGHRTSIASLAAGILGVVVGNAVGAAARPRSPGRVAIRQRADLPVQSTVVNGGRFTIARDLRCTGCASGARCAGSVAGSDHLLCLSLTDAICASNADCPAGTACQTRIGQCVSPC